MLHASTRARERERQVRRLALTRPKRTAPASLVWFVKWFGVQTSEIVGEGADTQAHKHHGANGPCSCLVIFVPKTIFQWFTTPMIERGKTHKPKLVQNSQQGRIGRFARKKEPTTSKDLHRNGIISIRKQTSRSTPTAS